MLRRNVLVRFDDKNKLLTEKTISIYMITNKKEQN
ncbi:hypothetical protein MTsN2n6_34120 [Vibrio fortis]